ncbi:MAG TPA: YeeE/YedE family protein [Xanthobacteraceae bacterium]|nr:YeeE/YedE family protein [Xanthobacteraceae bacterium]
MPAILTALGCGLIFGFGLAISGMTQPTRVLGFLDVLSIGTSWDPTLAFVMVGALAVAAPGFALARRRAKPVLAPASAWPTRTAIDRPLIVGAVLFGLGWGLVGLCPGPAIANLAALSPRVVAFVIAMAIGMLALDFWRRRGMAEPAQP